MAANPQRMKTEIINYSNNLHLDFVQ